MFLEIFETYKSQKLTYTEYQSQLKLHTHICSQQFVEIY